MTAFGNCAKFFSDSILKGRAKRLGSRFWSPPLLHAPLGKTLPVMRPDSDCLRQGFPRGEMGSQKTGLCASPSAAGRWVRVHWSACRHSICPDPNSLSVPSGNSSALHFQFRVGFKFHPSIQTCILLKEGAGKAGSYFSMSPIQNNHFLPKGNENPKITRKENGCV